MAEPCLPTTGSTCCPNARCFLCCVQFILRTIYRKKGRPPPEDVKAAPNQGYRRVPDETIEAINKEWVDTEKTGMMWELIKTPESEEFMQVLSTYPEIAHVRSKDGRGPMFWAHEHGRTGMIKVLRKLGVREDLADANGVKPTDITHPSLKGSN